MYIPVTQMFRICYVSVVYNKGYSPCKISVISVGPKNSFVMWKCSGKLHVCIVYCKTELLRTGQHMPYHYTRKIMLSELLFLTNRWISVTWKTLSHTHALELMNHTLTHLQFTYTTVSNKTAMLSYSSHEK